MPEKNLSKLKTFIYPVATLSGAIVGAGIFSLPYLTLKVGFWIMLAYFLVLGTLVILIHLFFGELSLKTPDLKRFPGFARLHLGKWGEKIALISDVLGIYGAILAYLVVGGEFLTELFSPILGGNSLIYTLFYFSLGALLIYFGIRLISQVELFALISFFLILISMFFKGFSHFEIKNLFPSPDFSQFFLPYGPLLFSFWGAALIPEAEEMLKGKKELLKKVIFIATLIPIIIYLLFIFLILGITGKETTESALIGLRNFLGNEIVSLALFFGVLTTFTSFIALGLTLKNVFCYDLKMNKNSAWLITCFFPLILFLIGIKKFISVISFVGGIMLGIDGILILLMYQKIKPERKLLSSSLISIFLAGIIYEIIYFIK